MSFTVPGFDEDAHAARNGYGDDDTPTLRLVSGEPTRCIEHGQLSCAECDGEWRGLQFIASKLAIEQEPLRMAA